MSCNWRKQVEFKCKEHIIPSRHAISQKCSTANLRSSAPTAVLEHASSSTVLSSGADEDVPGQLQVGGAGAGAACACAVAMLPAKATPARDIATDDRL
eukprot:13231466-Alexandrium_andersonii.AAC.1